MSPFEIKDIAESGLSVSGKIRALNDAGLSRAEIARALGKRYQHVRNVLEADKVAAMPSPRIDAISQAGFRESSQAFHGVHRLTVEPDGVVRLPPEVLQVLGARPGGVLVGEVEADRFVILSGRAAMAKARALVHSLGVDPSRILSEELIAERRAENARDSAHD